MRRENVESACFACAKIARECQGTINSPLEISKAVLKIYRLSESIKKGKNLLAIGFLSNQIAELAKGLDIKIESLTPLIISFYRDNSRIRL